MTFERPDKPKQKCFVIYNNIDFYLFICNELMKRRKKKIILIICA